MNKIQNLIGLKFGRLLVISRAKDRIQPSGRRAIYWLCKCDCGNYVEVQGNNLKNGNVSSCKCLQKERISNSNRVIKRNLKHGMRDSRIYHIWQRMKDRCYNCKQINYKNYGAKGIKICEDWKSNFQSFYKWSINNGYNDNLTIDRIDVNGNYEPSNCRWVSLKVQANNRSNNHYLNYKGEIHTIAEWAEIKNITYNSLLHRINRGWSIEKALETPNIRY